ncbi:hypothetical protein OAO01_05085 [Oligoflexia bacterium]|nr:hypothetical protein [Oligoflexia bacterium]
MSADDKSEEFEFDSPESWASAKAYAALFGDVPSSFSSTVRTLLKDHEKNDKKLAASSRFQVVRILNGPSTKAMFYFACQTFRKEQIPDKSYLAVKDLVNLFEPIDLAAIVGLIYLYKRCTMLCENVKWEDLSKAMQLESEVGGHLGSAIPSIGFGTGLLVGALPHLALCTFKRHDSSSFIHYAKFLEKNKLSFDIVYEAPRWGCTSLQVASCLLQNLGFGLEMTEAYVRGLDSRDSLENIKEDYFYRMCITRIWIESLLKTGDQPDISMRGAYYPLREELAELQKVTVPVRTTGPVYAWLEKTKDDATVEKTPMLFRKSAVAAAAVVKDEETAVEYPPELLEAFSVEELEKMSKEELDKLVAQMKEDKEDSA